MPWREQGAKISQLLCDIFGQASGIDKDRPRRFECYIERGGWREEQQSFTRCMLLLFAMCGNISRRTSAALHASWDPRIEYMKPNDGVLNCLHGTA